MILLTLGTILLFAVVYAAGQDEEVPEIQKRFEFDMSKREYEEDQDRTKGSETGEKPEQMAIVVRPEEEPNDAPNAPTFDRFLRKYNGIRVIPMIRIRPFTKRFDPFSKRFDPYVKRFDPYSKRFDPNTKRFDPYDKRFDPYVKRFDVFDKRFDVFEKRFDPYSKRFDPFSKRFDPYAKRFDPFTKRFDPYGKRFDIGLEKKFDRTSAMDKLIYTLSQSKRTNIIDPRAYKIGFGRK